MDKITVLLDKRDLVVKLDGKSLRVESPGEKIERIPLKMVDQVIVYGSPQVSCDVWRAMAEEGVAVVLLPARGTGAIAWLGTGISTSIQVRISQYKAWSDEQVKSNAISWLIRGKIEGYQALLKLLLNPEPWLIGPEVRLFQLSVKQLTKSISETDRFFSERLSNLSPLMSADSLRGVEGIAAKGWFAFLTNSINKHWKFKGRNRRPPLDPVNGLLSLGYTLLMGEVRREVHVRGLDPSLGFLHSAYPGRESFVLDIVEPLRSGVDAFVFSLLDRVLLPEHFTSTKKDGCRLTKEGRGLYYPAWIEWKKNWPVFGLKESNASDFQNLSFHARTVVEKFVQSWKFD